MDSEDAERTQFLALVALFRPHVEAVEMPKILAWARSPYTREEKKATLGWWFTPKESVRAAFNRPRMSEKMIDAVKDQWLTEATAMFVRGWTNILLRPLVDTNALDDDMLPATPGFVPDSIMIATSGDQYSEEEVRGILRAVKATLPPGQNLPAGTLELLRFIRQAEAHLFD